MKTLPRLSLNILFPLYCVSSQFLLLIHYLFRSIVTQTLKLNDSRFSGDMSRQLHRRQANNIHYFYFVNYFFG